MELIIKPFCLKAVFFDFDGTLTKPGSLDFAIIKNEIGCPLDTPVLEFMESLTDPGQKRKAGEALEAFEKKAAVNSIPQKGAEDLILYLKTIGLKTGIVSRNSRSSIDRALKNFNAVTAADFDVIVSRDDPVAPKPDKAGILLAAERAGVAAADTMMVGDFVFDIQAGQNAGTVTVLLDHGLDLPDVKSDYTIERLDDLRKIVRLGLPLSAGKLPNEFLKQFLGFTGFQDPSLLIHPGVGEDTAALDLNGAEVLVLTSDPITFATDAVGMYAVCVNANDMATSGAQPKWLMTSLLFPVGTTPAEIGHVMTELQRTCRRWDITLCGGHTEITDAVTRTVVTGTMTGTVDRDRLVDKRAMQAGDIILLTKRVCVEGTAIIAREFPDRLKAGGMLEEEIETCKDYLSDISILPEAKIAHGSKHVSAMHDVTEGGVATALWELSVAGHHGLRVDMDNIPVYPETARICRLLELDPLGLIGSGSLLIACRKQGVKQLMREIGSAGIEVACIGQVLDSGGTIEAFDNNEPHQWPHFDVDEITRLF